MKRSITVSPVFSLYSILIVQSTKMIFNKFLYDPGHGFKFLENKITKKFHQNTSEHHYGSYVERILRGRHRLHN